MSFQSQKDQELAFQLHLHTKWSDFRETDVQRDCYFAINKTELRLPTSLHLS